MPGAGVHPSSVFGVCVAPSARGCGVTSVASLARGFKGCSIFYTKLCFTIKIQAFKKPFSLVHVSDVSRDDLTYPGLSLCGKHD